jgi:hypothetical protein
MSTPQSRGADLEKKVAALLRQQGKANVTLNKLFRDKHGNLSEIDVTYGRWPFQHYIECKAYRKDRPVPLEDVAKFKQVLELNNINVNRGTVVTTSTFSPRCQHTGLRLINGTDLKQWEKHVHNRIWFRRSILGACLGSGIVATVYFPEETTAVMLRTKKQGSQWLERGKQYCLQVWQDITAGE